MDKFAMIIFGASGDLTKRKLMPALYSLYRDKRLTGDFSILGIGRTIYSDENYRSYILEELQQFVKADEQDTILMSLTCITCRWTLQRKKVTPYSANVWWN